MSFKNALLASAATPLLMFASAAAHAGGLPAADHPAAGLRPLIVAQADPAPQDDKHRKRDDAQDGKPRDHGGGKDHKRAEGGSDGGAAAEQQRGQNDGEAKPRREPEAKPASDAQNAPRNDKAAAPSTEPASRQEAPARHDNSHKPDETKAGGAEQPKHDNASGQAGTGKPDNGSAGETSADRKPHERPSAPAANPAKTDKGRKAEDTKKHAGSDKSQGRDGTRDGASPAADAAPEAKPAPAGKDATAGDGKPGESHGKDRPGDAADHRKDSGQGRADHGETGRPGQGDAKGDTGSKTGGQAQEPNAIGATTPPVTGRKSGDQAQQPAAGQNDGVGQRTPPVTRKDAGSPRPQEAPKNGDQPGRDGNTGTAETAKPGHGPDGKPIGNPPASNAAETAPNGTKPQRLDAPNGAPVLDSQKGDNRHGDHQNGDRNGADRRGGDRNGTEMGGNNDRSRGGDAGRAADRRDGDQGDRNRYREPVKIRSATEEKGRRVDEAPRYQPPQDVHIDKKVDNRYIVTIDNRTFIQNTDHRRIADDARDVYYEDLPGGNTRQVVERPDGTRVVTIRNSYGDVVQRSRFDHRGKETVLIYAPDYDRGGDRRDGFYRDPGADLPPLRLTEPVDDYILDAGDASTQEIETFLEKPPVQQVDRVYTLDQVRYSARLRDIMPRIDLDTITFDTGSADIGNSQARSLEGLARGIRDVIRRDPGQVFLIEGHTDAVGSDESNLLLSDRRAESVADALTRDFGVPPENLVTQGYGEQYLKIDVDGPERQNRRVTIRRITPLVRPANAR